MQACTAGLKAQRWFVVALLGLLGLANSRRGVNKWTHGTLINAMHGHADTYGAYATIVSAMINFPMCVAAAMMFSVGVLLVNLDFSATRPALKSLRSPSATCGV